MNLAKLSNEPPPAAEDPDVSDMIIRSYTTIGSLSGYGKVTVEAREHMIPERREIIYGVRIQAEGGGQYPTSRSASVAYGRIDALMSALDQMAEVTVPADRFAFSEIEKKIEDLTLVVFNKSTAGKGFITDGTPRLSFAISVADVFVDLHQLSRIDEFKKLIRRAKDHIDRNAIEI